MILRPPPPSTLFPYTTLFRSISFSVESHREGKVYIREFERGVTKNPLESIGTTDKRGTTVRFKPDPEIFTQTREFMFDIIADRMRELAFLNPEITVVLTDERDKEL